MVTVSKEIAVVADSSFNAKMIAEDNERDEDITYSVARETKDFTVGWKRSIPWGVENDDPRRDWTIEQWLENAA